MDESIEKKIIEESQDFSILSLFFQADIVVKIVILTLIASSVWSWTIIFFKIYNFEKYSYRNRGF